MTKVKPSSHCLFIENSSPLRPYVKSALMLAFPGCTGPLEYVLKDLTIYLPLIRKLQLLSEMLLVKYGKISSL